MDELQKILSDPSAMERISRMASQLMGGGGAVPTAPAPAPEAPPSGELSSLLRGLMGSGAPGGPGSHPLAAVLGPYLEEGRRRKLERALTAARAVKLSGSVLGRGGHGL